jgi:hypothetical protein
MSNAAWRDHNPGMLAWGCPYSLDGTKGLFVLAQQALAGNQGNRQIHWLATVIARP